MFSSLENSFENEAVFVAVNNIEFLLWYDRTCPFFYFFSIYFPTRTFNAREFQIVVFAKTCFVAIIGNDFRGRILLFVWKLCEQLSFFCGFSSLEHGVGNEAICCVVKVLEFLI